MLGNFGQSVLNGAAGQLFGNPFLRDYQHASKIFRVNAYENAPKFKFLFHTYFEINPQAYDERINFGILVKQVKLPSFNLTTHQMNQYNRKRIVQTKIKYDPIDIIFHDDNSNNVTKMWEAYYRYYYNDGSKPVNVLRAEQASSKNEFFDGNYPEGVSNFNTRDIYDAPANARYDWGLSGGQNPDPSGLFTGIKVPFFKSITVYGFNQHNFIAYTLINPMITSFSHDTYNYDSGNGTMENRMTIDYETVVYRSGALDGRDPSTIVSGFALPQNYDTTPSPNILAGANGLIIGQGGLKDAAGGFIGALKRGNIRGAIQIGEAAINQMNQNSERLMNSRNLTPATGFALAGALITALTNRPSNRNVPFSPPTSFSTPGLTGLSGSPTIGGVTNPPVPNAIPTAGVQHVDDGVQVGFPIEKPFNAENTVNTN
jgi:hypothetical protein